MKNKFLSLVLLSVCSYPAHAVLIYDESVHGDIFSLTTFTLGLGTNTVTGSMPFNGSYMDGLNNDIDIFNIYVPANTIMSSVTLTVQMGYLDPSSDYNFVDAGFSFQCSYDLSNAGSTGCNDAGPYPYGSATYTYARATQTLETDSYSFGDLNDLPGNTYYQIDAPSWVGVGLPSNQEDLMVSGAFDYSFAFEVTDPSIVSPPPPAVPVPSAFWLLASGLAAVLGTARRKFI